MVSLKSSMNFGMGAMKKARRFRDNYYPFTHSLEVSCFCIVSRNKKNLPMMRFLEEIGIILN